MRRLALVVLICSLGGVAWAQMPPPADQPPPVTPPEPTPAPATVTTTTSTTSTTPAAAASSDETVGSAVGVGVHAMLTGMYGPSIVYNGGRFHIDGIITFADTDNESSIGLGGHGWFHVHESQQASLSVGGGVGFFRHEQENPLMPSMKVKESDIYLEGGAQIRFFVTRNVALDASLGLAIVSGDADVISIVGALTGGFGVTYFLF